MTLNLKVGLYYVGGMAFNQLTVTSLMFNKHVLSFVYNYCVILFSFKVYFINERVLILSSVTFELTYTREAVINNRLNYACSFGL